MKLSQQSAHMYTQTHTHTHAGTQHQTARHTSNTQHAEIEQRERRGMEEGDTHPFLKVVVQQLPSSLQFPPAPRHLHCKPLPPAVRPQRGDTTHRLGPREHQLLDEILNRLRARDSQRGRCKKTAFFEFFLCLSRACLGKMLIYIYKVDEKCRFLTWWLPSVVAAAGAAASSHHCR